MALFKKSKPGKKIQPTGKFIVLDGIDGSGKRTQADLLVNSLRLAGYPVEFIDFPQYDLPSSQMLENYLAGNYGVVNAYAGSVFYAINRFDFAPKMKQWLAEGKIIVADRYVTANAGHQGGKIDDALERLKYFKWLDHLEYTAFGIPRPDLTLVLHVPPKFAQRLLKQRGKATTKAPAKKDWHETDLSHLKRAEQTYLEIAKLFPRTKLVECVAGDKLLAPKQIHNKVWELVRRIALKNELPYERPR